MITTKELYSFYLQHPTICTDTRAITTGCLFFALKGEHFDANQYADQAISFGAAYAIVDQAQYCKNDRYILVDDTLSALQDLARIHRGKLTIPVIGVTGSNGKTTSKELIKAVLSQRYKTFATHGNLNNHIGVPLSILSIHSDIEIAIIEMGANHQKEIEFLCTIAQPSHGIITNVGKAHLEGFGGFTGVMAGKSELYTHLRKTAGIAFINRDNSLLIEMSQAQNLEQKQIIYYGTDASVYVNGKLVNESPFLTVQWQAMQSTNPHITYTAKSSLTGAYNFENILAAICIGHFFKLNSEQINTGIEAYTPTNNRSQLTKTDSNTLICDYYNANPTSMSFALDNLARIDAPKKVIILGDMFELGDESEKEHLYIVQKAGQIAANQRIFIGKAFYKCKTDGTDQFYYNIEEAQNALRKHPIQDAIILLKGSRSMKLEALTNLL